MRLSRSDTSEFSYKDPVYRKYLDSMIVFVADVNKPRVVAHHTPRVTQLTLTCK